MPLNPFGTISLPGVIATLTSVVSAGTNSSGSPLIHALPLLWITSAISRLPKTRSLVRKSLPSALVRKRCDASHLVAERNRVVVGQRPVGSAEHGHEVKTAASEPEGGVRVMRRAYRSESGLVRPS